MTVELIGWAGHPSPGGGKNAVALIDGTRVTIRRSRGVVRWTCDAHGSRAKPHCPHTRRLEHEPADPTKRNGRP